MVLDNAEFILEPLGINAQEIYALVDELSQFSNIYLIIISHISAVPPHREVLDISMLSTESVCDTFDRIHQCEQSNSINHILEQLDFHPHSVILLATVAQGNKSDTSRLAKGWETQRTGVLRVQHSGSLSTPRSHIQPRWFLIRMDDSSCYHSYCIHVMF